MRPLVELVAIRSPQLRTRLARWGWEPVLVAAVLAAVVAVHLPTLSQLLQEEHGFRQTQTAYPAVIFDQRGIDLLHPKLPILGPPFEVPFEFPLFQALAVVPMKLGLPADTAVRLTGLICFLATALLLYGLLRHVAGRPAAAAGLVAFAFSPFAMLWSRTSMIEYLATAGAVGFAWAAIRWREEGRLREAGLALSAGSIALLVKPTTGVFWILPALAWRPPRFPDIRGWARSLLSPTLAAIVLVPIVLGLLWTRHADAIKDAQSPTRWLTSSNLANWNYGSLDQRLHWDNWSTIGDRFVHWVVAAGLVLLPIAALAAWRSRQRLFWLAMAGTVVLPPLVFFNLYVVHDYYLAAVTPGAAALVGLGAGWLWERFPAPRARAAEIACGLLLVSGSLIFTHDYWRLAFDDVQGFAPAVAAPLKRSTEPSELALEVPPTGYSYSPEILYYARRWGRAINVQDRLHEHLGKQAHRYHVMLSTDPYTDPINHDLVPWPWVGAIDERLYAMAGGPSRLWGSAVISTDDRSAFADASHVGSRLPAPGRVRCGAAPLGLHAGRLGTWLRIKAPHSTRIVIDGYSPLPARPTVAVAPKGKWLSVTCFGAPSLTIVETIDAPPPVRCGPPRPFRWRGCANPG